MYSTHEDREEGGGGKPEGQRREGPEVALEAGQDQRKHANDDHSAEKKSPYDRAHLREPSKTAYSWKRSSLPRWKENKVEIMMIAVRGARSLC